MSTYTSDILITLRDQEVLITEIHVCAAEPDVGLMSSYCDGFKLTDAEGKDLDWELTSQEDDIVMSAINKWLEDGGADIDFDDYYDGDHNGELL